jgi:hypothetical protein
MLLSISPVVAELPGLSCSNLSSHLCKLLLICIQVNRVAKRQGRAFNRGHTALELQRNQPSLAPSDLLVRSKQATSMLDVQQFNHFVAYANRALSGVFCTSERLKH